MLNGSPLVNSGHRSIHRGYLAPFDGVTEQLRAKMEVAAKPKEEVEEEDTEGVDLYKVSGR